MTTLRFHDGQAHIAASLEEPFPVRVMGDVQNLNLVGSTGQKSVLTTATLIVPPNANRRSIKITHLTGGQDVYLGFTNAVSASTGDYFSATKGSSITIYAKGAIYGIAVSVAQTVTWMEEEVDI